jgi:hypothetical protein
MDGLAERGRPPSIMDRLLAMTKNAQCSQLQFDRVLDAANLLVDEFHRPAVTGKSV